MDERVGPCILIGCLGKCPQQSDMRVNDWSSPLGFSRHALGNESAFRDALECCIAICFAQVIGIGKMLWGGTMVL